MSSESKNIKDIFLAAVEIPFPAERGAFLDEACAGDAALRQRVEALLKAHDEPGSFLAPPAVLQGGIGAHMSDQAETIAPRSSPETAGAHIGPYKLLQQIGEGGMGTVWMAEQTEPVRRIVALKIIKAGMDSALVIARFEAERQALALMDHPNIARVLNAGSTDAGRPYFVMELVKGTPITKYCDAHRLTVRQRLELFASVCQALQHAHQKGIIHRDLKPSNVLIAPYDGKPVVKVIDFGVAKATGPRLTERTLFTEFGAMIGTLEYMSPEQAELNNLDIDTRSDIYSLGVLLYELLTGTTPLNMPRLQGAALAAILMMIQEEEPPRPSTRLSNSKDSLPSISAERQTEPAKLPKLVRGDLDWIVMKALEKDRNRRYDTANGLARDIERYLHEEPVEACPPRTGYRLRKFVRRNKGPVLAATIVVLALIGGIVGTTWGLLRAQRARQAAETAEANEREQRLLAELRQAEADDARQKESAERERAEQEELIAWTVRDFLQNKLLRQADIREQANALLRAGRASAEAKWNPTIRELLDRAAAELTPDKIEAQFPNQPGIQAEILSTIGNTYERIGEYGPAIAHLERARDLRHQQVGPNHPDTLRALVDLAYVYEVAGKVGEAIVLFEQARDKVIEKFGPDDEYTLATLGALAWAYQVSGKTPEAIRLYEQVREKAVAKLGSDHPTTLSVLEGLAWVYQAAGRHSDALRLFEQVRDKQVEKLGPEHPDTLDMMAFLASAYQSAGKLPEAIRLYEQVQDKQVAKLGSDHPSTLITQGNLAWAYQAAGKTADAIRVFEEVRDKQREKLGSDHPVTLVTMHCLAQTYFSAKRLDLSLPLCEQVLEKQKIKLGLDHPHTLATMRLLAANYGATGRPGESMALLEEAMDRSEKGPGLLRGINALLARAAALACDQAGEYRQSEALYRVFVEEARRHYGADDPRKTDALDDLGKNLLQQKKYAEAEPILRECLAIREKKEPDAWTTFNTKSLLGGALLGQKKYAEAETLLLQGYEGMKEREGKAPVAPAPGSPVKNSSGSSKTGGLTLPARLVMPPERIREAQERLVQLYEAWDKPEKAGEWRKTLEDAKAKRP